MQEDIYFCMDLTENEHSVVERMLREFCVGNGLELVYYRKIKKGHIPCVREIKVKFNGKRGTFLKYMNEEIKWDCVKKCVNGILVPWQEAWRQTND